MDLSACPSGHLYNYFILNQKGVLLSVGQFLNLLFQQHILLIQKELLHEGPGNWSLSTIYEMEQTSLVGMGPYDLSGGRYASSLPMLVNR